VLGRAIGPNAVIASTTCQQEHATMRIASRHVQCMGFGLNGELHASLAIGPRWAARDKVW
jgi:hypothetical protein